MENEMASSASVAKQSDEEMRAADAKREIERIKTVGDVRGMSSEKYETAKASLGIRKYAAMRIGR